MDGRRGQEVCGLGGRLVDLLNGHNALYSCPSSTSHGIGSSKQHENELECVSGRFEPEGLHSKAGAQRKGSQGSRVYIYLHGLSIINYLIV
jgi:hypothetical protein